MRTKIIIIFLFLVFSFIITCGKHKENNVPIEQIKIDKSTDYKYIFKDKIEEEKKKEDQNKKDPFQE